MLVADNSVGFTGLLWVLATFAAVVCAFNQPFRAVTPVMAPTAALLQ